MDLELGQQVALALRLLEAAALGALIGLEREVHEHPAGMRTHLLVSRGSGGIHGPLDRGVQVPRLRTRPGSPPRS